MLLSRANNEAAPETSTASEALEEIEKSFIPGLVEEVGHVVAGA